MNSKRTLLKTVAAAALATMAMGTAIAADITGAGAITGRCTTTTGAGATTTGAGYTTGAG